MILAPILIMEKEKMINGDPFFILIALSRYLRFPYFFIVLMRNHEFAETDIDKAITMQLVMIINMAIILAGIFGEMENSHFLIGIEPNEPTKIVDGKEVA